MLAWSLISRLATLASLLGLQPGLVYFLGGDGQGDLVARDGTGTVHHHVEFKSGKARASFGEKCSNACSAYASQFTHMGEDARATILIITHTHRTTAAWNMAIAAGVAARTTVVTFGQLADHLQAALEDDAIPCFSIVASMLDVEVETDALRAAQDQDAA